MKKVLFKNDAITFYLEEKATFFNCGVCGQMGNEVPVRSISHDKKIQTYHYNCAQGEIYRIQRGDSKFSRFESQELKLPTIEVSPEAQTPKKTFLRPIEDEELERKKAKLKALLVHDREDVIATETHQEKEKEVAKPKARIELNSEGKIVIYHAYDANLIDKYHFLGNIKWKEVHKYWECNIKEADYETCRFFFKIYKDIPKFEWLITEEAYQVIKARIDYHEEQIRASKEIKELKAKVDIDIDLSHMKIEPYPYQKVGISFLNKIKGIGMIGDSMGVGKTIQAIGYASLNKLSTVVVCPASLKYNWQKEILKFSDCTAVVLTEFDQDVLSPKNKLADFVIINYEQLEKYEKYLKKAKFDCVILDESQYIMNLQAVRTKMVFKFFKKVPHRICLSGTPIKNRPIEFYPQLKFLRPDMFSNKMKYALRYCDAKETAFGWDLKGSSNLDELNRKISSFYIRRNKSEVLKELPPKTISVLDIEMGVTERNEYQKIKRDFDRFMDDNWKQYGKDYANQRLDGAHLSKLMELKQYCSKLKISRVKAFVNEFLSASSDRKILIFSQFIATQKALREAFPGVSVSLLGEDTDVERQAAVEKFQTDPNTRVFVGSMLAAGVGLTLTAADTVVFADLMWSPSDHEQAADRVHRIGQDSPVFIYYMIFKNSIESMIWEVIGNKLEVITQVLGGKAASEALPDVPKVVFKKFLEEFRSDGSDLPPNLG